MLISVHFLPVIRRDFVSSAARRCMILANHFRKSQSAFEKLYLPVWYLEKRLFLNNGPER